MYVRIINIESKTGAIIRIFLKFAIFSIFRFKFSIWPHPCKVTKFPSIFLFFNIFKLTQVKLLTQVWPSSFLNFLMSKHMKFSEMLENPGNCSGFGFYIHNTHVHFPKQVSLLYTRGTEQIIPTKNNIEDGGTSMFACGQGRY